jgi:phosphate transport system protein
MSLHLNRAIEQLKVRILTLSGIIEDSLTQAVKALQNRDTVLAKQVHDRDPEIDQTEVDIEEECLKILALHQPVANDLRFIIAVLKINNDLEPIRDLSVNLARITNFILETPGCDIPFDYISMGDKVRTLLRKSLDSLVNMDTALAREVCASDDEIDDINRSVYKLVSELMKKYPEKYDCLINAISISRYLERIADQTTNIAEDVIYMVEGRIVRHRL